MTHPMTIIPPVEEPNKVVAMPSKPWPLGGYAPGNYMCQCATCGKRFEGDKRAVTCLECAASQANDRLTGQHRRAAKAVTDGNRRALAAGYASFDVDDFEHMDPDVVQAFCGDVRTLASIAASPPATGVRVKLEWHGDEAKTPFGRYTVTRTDDGYQAAFEWDEIAHVGFNAVDVHYGARRAAQDHAQADYEARIRSALGEHP